MNKKQNYCDTDTDSNSMFALCKHMNRYESCGTAHGHGVISRNGFRQKPTSKHSKKAR